MELLPILGFVVVVTLTLNYIAAKALEDRREKRAQQEEGWVEITPTPASTSPPRKKKGKPETPLESWVLRVEGGEVVLRQREEERRFSGSRDFAQFLRGLPPGTEIQVPEKLPPVVTAILEAATHVRLSVTD